MSPGPYGHPAEATGVHARRTAILPEPVGRRQRGSAMFAAKPHEAEQGPEGISEPRNVAREWRRPVATGDQTCSEPKTGPETERAGWGRQPARQVFFRPGLLRGRRKFRFDALAGGAVSNSCNIFPLLGGNGDVSDVVTQSEHCGGQDDMEEVFQLALVIVFVAVLLVSGQLFMEYRASKSFDGPAVATLTSGTVKTR
jgi:hypothetical protein